MLLAIDIGNTHISCGVFKNNELLKTWKLSTAIHKTEDEYGLLILEFLSRFGIIVQDIGDIIISSVVPLINNRFEKMTLSFFNLKPLFIGRYLKIDMPILYDNLLIYPQARGPDPRQNPERN